MNTRELIELTVLDSLGLLDEQEQADFDRAFQAASPAVRRQVRSEQERFADLEGLLPDVEPTPELRTKVLEAVRTAMREPAQATPVRTTAHKAGRAVPQIAATRRVSRVWRAMALGLAAATVVLSVVTIQLQREYAALEDSLLVDSMIEEFGAEYVHDMLFDTGTRHVKFVPTDTGYRGEATVIDNPDWEGARLFYMNLGAEADTTYRLVVLDDKDKIVRVVHEFRAEGQLEDAEVAVDLERESRLAILPTPEQGDSEPVLRTIELDI